VTALAQTGDTTTARAELVKLARVNALSGWRFSEWLHGRSGRPRGMPCQSWNAAAYLMACAAIDRANP
jgi:hypothetical protein